MQFQSVFGLYQEFPFFLEIIYSKFFLKPNRCFQISGGSKSFQAADETLPANRKFQNDAQGTFESI